MRIWYYDKQVQESEQETKTLMHILGPEDAQGPLSQTKKHRNAVYGSV